MRVKIYIEGGGDCAALDTSFREAWKTFFEKAGFARLESCGAEAAVRLGICSRRLSRIAVRMNSRFCWWTARISRKRATLLGSI